MASRLSVASPIGSGDQNELKEIHVKMSKKIAQLTKGKNHNIFLSNIIYEKLPKNHVSFSHLSVKHKK